MDQPCLRPGRYSRLMARDVPRRSLISCNLRRKVPAGYMVYRERTLKFFNIDMHISVIHDVQHIFQDLGHTVSRASLSGHNWVIDSNNGGITYPSRRNWRQIGPKMVEKFYRKYKDKLAGYDGFVHSFPPAFALLFEPFEKPVVTVTCTRFDYPTVPSNYSWLVQGLRRMTASGQLTSVANNLLDKFYVERFLGIETVHISSLCNYMNVKKTGPQYPEFLLWTRGGQKFRSSKVSNEFSIEKKYDRETIRDYAGVVHLPYNLSVMSAFEHYWQNIPMYFPSQSFQKNLFHTDGFSLTEVLFPDSALYFDENLIGLADWYDVNNFSAVRHFDSFENLDQLLADDDLTEISAKMEASNKLRMQSVYEKWSSVLRQLS